MNALWVSRMCAYLHSSCRLESAYRIVQLKVARESALLRRYGCMPFPSIQKPQTIEGVLLTEARAARHFWRKFRNLLLHYPEFKGRNPRVNDPVNRLLDIGYHHLTTAVQKILTRLEVPSALGILHSPRNADSAPLAYDLIEMFRADTVNTELLRFLRLKKKHVEINQSVIGHFLHDVNERLERTYYLRSFGACHTYRYYMELQILKFVSAVNHREAFDPIHLPTRHDSRCSVTLDKNNPVVVQSSSE